MTEIVVPLLALGYLGLEAWFRCRRRQAELAAAAEVPEPRPREPLPPPDPPRGDWQSLVGREIEAVIVTGHGGPEVRTQVFLVLDGNEHFEVYTSGWLMGGSGVYRGGVFELMSGQSLGPKLRVYGEVEAPEPQAGE